MITIRSTSLKPLIGGKVTKVDTKHGQLKVTLDNGRCLTMMLKIRVDEASIEPEAELFCGFNKDYIPKKGEV